MGRKNKPLSQSQADLTISKQEDKAIAENLAKSGFGDPQKSPPRSLDKIAAAEYRRILKAAKNLPWTDLDRSVLELYCFWYSVYKRDSKRYTKFSKEIDSVDKEIDKIELKMKSANKKESKEKLASLRVKLDGLERRTNNLLTKLDKATKNIKGSASDLGLTVDSRMRIAMPREEKSGGSILDQFGG